MTSWLTIKNQVIDMDREELVGNIKVYSSKSLKSINDEIYLQILETEAERRDAEYLTWSETYYGQE